MATLTELSSTKTRQINFHPVVMEKTHPYYFKMLTLLEIVIQFAKSVTGRAKNASLLDT